MVYSKYSPAKCVLWGLQNPRVEGKNKCEDEYLRRAIIAGGFNQSEQAKGYERALGKSSRAIMFALFYRLIVKWYINMHFCGIQWVTTEAN